MIHYGKTPSGDLDIRVQAEDVADVYMLLESSGLLSRRNFDGLRRYLAAEFSAEIRKKARL